MTIDNDYIAEQFSLLGKIMDIHGENSFKTKSYSVAAYTLERLPESLAALPPEKITQADPSTLTEYGHLLETFAVGEILKQVSWSDAPVTVGYFRTERGDEVDLVLERDDGQVIAFEIKAGTRVGGEDLHGLRLLKERLGPRLQEAVILYTGQYAYRYEDWAWVLPLSQLWA